MTAIKRLNRSVSALFLEFQEARLDVGIFALKGPSWFRIPALFAGTSRPGKICDVKRGVKMDAHCSNNIIYHESGREEKSPLKRFVKGISLKPTLVPELTRKNSNNRRSDRTVFNLPICLSAGDDRRKNCHGERINFRRRWVGAIFELENTRNK